MRTMDGIEKEFAKKSIPRFDVGDTVDVHVKIIEGDREREQIFSGTVIAKRHQGLSETFTVRRIVQGEGVERIFPVHSPRIVKVDVKKKGKVRRAKLHYLRDRVGRAQKVEERIGAERVASAPAASAPKPEPPASAEPVVATPQPKAEEKKAEQPAKK
ncbi:MAG: 50S ribosomal protein L19 [Planctomycetes bacterium]|nr:50S ribosomal protein L19 [Planctomycetota bacterium]